MRFHTETRGHDAYRLSADFGLPPANSRTRDVVSIAFPCRTWILDGYFLFPSLSHVCNACAAFVRSGNHPDWVRLDSFGMSDADVVNVASDVPFHWRVWPGVV